MPQTASRDMRELYVMVWSIAKWCALEVVAEAVDEEHSDALSLSLLAALCAGDSTCGQRAFGIRQHDGEFRQSGVSVYTKTGMPQQMPTRACQGLQRLAPVTPRKTGIASS